MKLVRLKYYGLLFAFFAFTIGGGELNAKTKPAEVERPWYIYNGVQAGSFDAVFLPDGEAIVSDTSFTRNYLFVSYRFTPNWTGFAGFGAQLFESDITNPSFAQRFGDSLFGGSYRFLKSNFGAFGLSLAAKVPLSDYPIENLSAQGDGQVDIKAALKYKKGFGLAGFYNEVKARAGHNFRFASPADQLVLDLDYRFYLFSFLAVRLGGGYIHAYDGTEYGTQGFSDVFAEDGAGEAFVSLKTRYLSYRAGLDIIPLERLTVSLVFSRVISGQNAANVQNFGLSLGYNF